MNSRQSSKRKIKGSPRVQGSGTAHHKNMKFRRSGRKSGQDEGYKTDSQKLVERFKDGGQLGTNAMKKVALMLDGREKTSQKELTELVSALMEAVEGDDYNARIRAVDFIVKFFGTKDIYNNDKKEILRKTDKKRRTPVLVSILNSMKDNEFDIRFYATKAIVEAVKNELVEDDIKDKVKLKLEGASASGSQFIRTSAIEGIAILKATGPAEEAVENTLEEKPVEGKAHEVKEAPFVEEQIKEQVPEEVEIVEEDIIKLDELHAKKQKMHQMIIPDELLLADFKDTDSSVRVKALQKIQKIIKKGDDASVYIPELLELLGDIYLDVRMEASCTLKEIGKPVIPALIEVLNNRKWHTRYEAVWTLGNLRDESATRPLINVLVNDTNDSVRKAAVEALGKIAMANPNTKSIGIIIALVSALEDKKKDVRKNAVEALGEILEHGATKESRQLIREALGIASKDEDPEVKRAAVKAKNDIGHAI